MSIVNRTWADELVELATAVTGADEAHSASLSRAVAAEETADLPPEQRVSGLNHDGTPLQLCVTLSRAGAASRVLADPAAGEPDLERRFLRACGALDAALKLGGSDQLRELCVRLLTSMVPDAAAVRACPDGALWLAAGLSKPGVAVYVDARVAGRDGVRAWLARELGETEGTALLCAALDDDALVQSLGVEGRGDAARVKVYWRLSRSRRLDAIGPGALADARFADFVTAALRPRGRMRLSGIVCSAGVAAHDGSVSDVKLDLCGCPSCLDLDAAQWQGVVEEVAARNDLPVPAALPELFARSEVAFVGFGLDAAGDPRLNVYAKEPG
jgi:hypothetical protein